MTTSHGDDANSSISFVKTHDTVTLPTSKDYENTPPQNSSIQEILSQNPKIIQLLLNTNKKDKKEALAWLNKLQKKHSSQERFYILSKILIKNGNNIT